MKRNRIICSILAAFIVGNYGMAANDSISPRIRIEARMDSIRQARGLAPSMKSLNMAAITQATPLTATTNYSSLSDYAVGEIPIQSGVSPMGARTYNVPIEVYPGIGEMTPQISLSYNSMQGSGIAGVGWNIAGLSSIVRTNKSLHYDGKVEGISQNADDAFMLDGQRLIRIADENGTPCFQTAQGNIKVKATLTDGDVSSFTVLYPDGRRAVHSSLDDGKMTYPMTGIGNLYSIVIRYNYTCEQNNHLIQSITYNNDNAKIEFIYEGRSDSTVSYANGLPIIQNKRLKKVTCKWGVKTLGEYNLSYSDINSASHLTSIGYTANGESLSPLTFAYGEGNGENSYATDTINVINIKSPTVLNSNKNIRLSKGKFYYFQSEGLLVLPNRTSYLLNSGSTSSCQVENEYNNISKENIYVAYDLESAYSPAFGITIGKGFADVFCADIEGNQQEYIIKANNTISAGRDILKFYLYTHYGVSNIALLDSVTFDTGNVFTNSKGVTSVRPKNFHVGDFNGDGRQDVMVIICPVHEGDNAVVPNCFIYDLANNQVIYQGKPFNYSPLHPIKGQNNEDRLSSSERLFVLDYNGDGKSDIGLINANGISVYEFYTVGDYITSCQQANSTTNITKSTLTNRELLFGEFNGDGLVDLMITPLKNNSDNLWSIYYSKGDGSYLSKTFTGPIPGNDSANDGFVVQDVNCDGKTDLIQYTKNSFTTFLTREDHPESTSVHTQAIDQYSTIAPTSITSHNQFSQILTLKKNILTKLTFQNDACKQRLLTTMTNSFCNTEHTTYKYPHDEGSSYNVQQNEQITFPYVILKERIPFIASSYQMCNGNQYNDQWFEFSNLVLHRQGLGVCGMESSQSSIDNFITTKIYDPSRYGILLRENTRKGGVGYNTLISEGTYTYEIIHPNAANNAFVQVNLTNKVSKDHLKDFTTTSAYTYNEYGFPITETVSSSDGYITNTTQNVIHHTSPQYVLNVTNEKTITTTYNGMTHTEKITFPEMYYNKPLKKYSYINGNQVSFETFSYSSINGLLLKKTIQHYVAPETYTTSYMYDFYGRMMKETSPEQYTQTYTYNSNGQVATYKDELGNITSYTYDAFGRKIRTDYADGTWETTQYSWQNGSPTNYGALVNSFGYCITTTHSNGGWEKAYYDTKQQNVENHSSTVQDYSLVEYRTYDTHGNLLTQSVPAIYAPVGMWFAWHRHTYDPLNRLTSTASPYGKNITYAYNKNQVITVEDSITTTRTYDSQGNMTAVTDPTGTTTYTYRPDGQMLSATVPSGLTTTVEYDGYGRRTKLIDPCAGITTFTYNACGQIVSKTDGTGKQTKMNYDEFRRLARKEYVGTLITNYTYNNKGLLTRETDSNGATRSFGYDQYGRLAWDYQSIDSLGTHNLKRTYSYATDGNLASVTYAQEDGSNAMQFGTEYFEYNNGHLKKTTFESASLTGGRKVIWDVESIDGYGITETAASGCLRHYYIHDALGLLNYIVSEKDEEEVLQDNEYNYNEATGNLSSRINYVHGIEEEFTYDHMNRLTGDGFATFSYDNTTGNMTYNSRLGSITYGQLQPSYKLTAIDPLTGIGSTTSNYMSTLQQTATYNAMSRPATITENKHTLEFTYNGRGERVKSRFYKTDNSNPVLGTVITDLEQRYYLGNIYERHIKEDDEERTILYLGGDAYSAPAAFVMDEQYGPHMAYICRDHLGSITFVVSDQYTKEYSYDAWGNRRDPQTYSLQFNTLNDDLFLGRGYTGHEHHGYFGLINMNARMYEPILGRFISPDPFVQMPDNSQNFNRYTYCLNNPLRYTDESGEWFLIDDLFAIIVGGTINLTSNIIQGNINGNFWECIGKGAAAFGAGGVAGWGGLHPELGGWAWGGAIAGATNAWLGGATTAEGILFGGAMGIVSSGAGALGGHIGNQFGSVIINGTKIASPAFASTITGALGGGIGGYTGGLAVGLLATGDFSEAHDMALDGALSGGVIGAATGFAGGIKYARDNKISPWTGEKTQNHHSFPKFLGGNDKQILTPMETSRHRTLHKELNEYLKTQTSDDKRYNMFPRKGNPGKDIQKNFTDITRINAAKTFYDSNKWRYWDARFDFYRNNKMIWTPW